MSKYKSRSERPNTILLLLVVILSAVCLYLFMKPTPAAPVATDEGQNTHAPDSSSSSSSSSSKKEPAGQDSCAADALALGYSADYGREGARNLSQYAGNLLGRVSRRFELPTTAGRKGYTPEDWAKFAPVVTCPPDRPVTQYGGTGDGSKHLCKLREQLINREKCVIYSLGSNGNFHFEDAMLAATPCEVHTFDCTFNGQSKGKRHFYYKWCVGPQDESNKAQGEFRTWANITKTLGHASVDLLKMDIEGWENSVLGELKPDLALPDELAVEFHVGVSGKDDYVPHTSAAMAAVFLHLCNLGYAQHFQEINAGFPFFGCEISFIRFPRSCRA